jgi:hypothetical protein
LARRVRQCGCPQLPRRGDSYPNRAKTRKSAITGVDEVNSVSYLPAAFTTLFFLAAGLLLGVIR